MSHIAPPRASSSSAHTSSSSAASALKMEDSSNDAAKSLSTVVPEKEGAMSCTQPHLLSSTSSPRASTATRKKTPPLKASTDTRASTTTMQPPAPSMTAPRRPRTPSLASSASSSTFSRPKRQKKEVTHVIKQQQQQDASQSAPSQQLPTSDPPAVRRRQARESPSEPALSETAPIPEPILDLHSRPSSRAPSAPSVAPASMTMSAQHNPTVAAFTPAPSTQRPAPLAPLQPMSSVAASAGVFEVMLNHIRTKVDRRHPFLNPASLFTPHPPLNPTDLSEELTADLTPPLHRYGNRPVLLLDYTGTLHLRHQRRLRRKAIQEQTSRLLAERKEQVRIARVWRMRRLRALRRNQVDFNTTAILDSAAENTVTTTGMTEEQATAAAGTTTPSSFLINGVLRTAAEVERYIKATAERRTAISRELQELQDELAFIAQEKQWIEETREGCVLMLPAADTKEVRLCSGHHYRTVCFVGEELMDVVPGEGPVPRPLHAVQAIPTKTAPAVATSMRSPSPDNQSSTHCHHRHSHICERNQLIDASSQTRTKAALKSSVDRKIPQWANAELLGFVMYRRHQLANKKPKRRSRVDDQKNEDNDSDESTALINAYLALPACEAAMYREWAIRKYGLSERQR